MESFNHDEKPRESGSLRVLRNDYTPIERPEPGDWTPRLGVSVIVPAHGCQATLDLTLASLSVQTYPSELLEVIVVDDGSSPPLVLPEIRPENCRILRAPDDDWGAGHARRFGVLTSGGAILHWLDADMVIDPAHVEAQARWQHVLPDAVTVGYKRFAKQDWRTSVEEVLRRCREGTLDSLFPPDGVVGHEYIECIIDGSHGLRRADHLCFQVHVGCTAALSRELYDEAGGMTVLRGSEDTEFGYRLAQAGAVFVPEPGARGWHLGPLTVMRRRPEVHRHNHPYYADLVPYPRGQRRASGRVWSVPLVVAAVPADGFSYEQVKACVDRLLSGSEEDLRVVLVGRWSSLTDGRRRVLEDPLLDLRLVREHYRGDPRVGLCEESPSTAFPSPWLLEVPPRWGFSTETLAHLIAEADEWQVGLVRVLMPEVGPEVPGVRLVRTSALSRARRTQRSDESLDHAIGAVQGLRWVSGDLFEITDLEGLTEEELASPVRRPRAAPRRSSPAKPTGLRRYVRGARRRIRRLMQRVRGTRP